MAYWIDVMSYTTGHRWIFNKANIIEVIDNTDFRTINFRDGNSIDVRESIDLLLMKLNKR